MNTGGFQKTIVDKFRTKKSMFSVYCLDFIVSFYCLRFGYEPRGRGFESSPVRHFLLIKQQFTAPPEGVVILLSVHILPGSTLGPQLAESRIWTKKIATEAVAISFLPLLSDVPAFAG